MAIKIGINGFGRIGRNVFRIMAEQGDDFDVVQINDLMAPDLAAHLLKYDSVCGTFDGTVEATANGIVVNGKEIEVSAEKDPANLPWASKNVDIVLESTGVFRTRDGIVKHLEGGAKKVLLSVPSKKPEEIDATIVLGVNDDDLSPEDKLVSNASCTTNCLAPTAKVLQDNFGIVRGLMTTIHSYTNDQVMLDGPHKDKRRARAGATNIIPTTTGAAKAVGLVMPALKGKLNGCAMRVPTPTGSLVDLTAELQKDVTADDVNAAMKQAAEGPLKGILRYTDEPIVQADIVGDPASAIFDADSTMVMEKSMVKVIAWYDNEWGYSQRCVDLFRRMA